jgi:hypothetical protein
MEGEMQGGTHEACRLWANTPQRGVESRVNSGVHLGVLAAQRAGQFISRSKSSQLIAFRDMATAGSEMKKGKTCGHVRRREGKACASTSTYIVGRDNEKTKGLGSRAGGRLFLHIPDQPTKRAFHLPPESKREDPDRRQRLLLIDARPPCFHASVGD